MSAPVHLGRTCGLLLAAVVILAGCVPRAQPAAKDVLTIGVTSQIYTLNPVTMSPDAGQSFAPLVWVGLLGVDARGHPFPILATAVPTVANGGIGSNGRSITFDLQPGLRWSDGAPITARDIRFGWRLAIQSRAQLCPATCWDIRDVRVIGARRVRFLLDRPYSPILFDLPPVLPRHALWRGNWQATFAQVYQPSMNFVGRRGPVDGPFEAVSTSATSTTFVRNPYWTALERPAYAKVVVRTYPNIDAMFNATRDGAVKLSQGYGLSDIGRLGLDRSGLRMMMRPGGILEHLEPNILRPPLRDVRVRQALSLAIDRARLLVQALQVPIAEARRLVAYSPEVHHRFDPIVVHGAWDPIRHAFVSGPELRDARQLLAAAGWRLRSDGYRYRGGSRLDLQVYVPYGDSARFAEINLLAQMWQRIGVAVTPVFWPVSGLLASFTENGPCSRGWDNLCLFAQFAQYDPETDYQLEFTSNHIARQARRPTRADINYPGIDSGRLDRIFHAAATTYDLRRRAALYSDWQRQVVRDADWIVLFERPSILVAGAPIRNLNPTQWGAEWNPWALAPGRSR